MTGAKQERRGLGRGLSALMADVGVDERPTAEGQTRGEIRVPIEKILPNPDQPRRSFAAESLDDLAASIKEKGIIQPLILRQHPEQSGQYQIVAGERRWRAAQMAQLHDAPALIRDFSDTEVLEVAIIENIQRADLNPIDEAAGYKQLMDRFGHTQEQMATALGKSRSHIANLLRLLQLPPDVQTMLAAGQLTAGHARALVTTDNPSEIARHVVAKGLSVRETERLAKAPTGPSSNSTAKSQEKDADTRVLERELAAAIGMRVSIRQKAGGEAGELKISYKSLDQLDEICRVLSGEGA